MINITEQENSFTPNGDDEYVENGLDDVIRSERLQNIIANDRYQKEQDDINKYIKKKKKTRNIGLNDIIYYSFVTIAISSLIYIIVNYNK